MNIVEFGIKIKDMASGTLRKFGVTASKAVAATATSVSKTASAIANTARKAAESNRKVKTMAESTAQGFNEVTNAARKAGNEIDKVKKKADNAQKATQKKESNKGGAWDYVKGSAIYGGIMTAGSMAASLFTDAMQAGLDRQKIQTSFDVLSGSKETGAELTKQLVDLQQSTILGSEVFANAQTMMGFGFNALKQGEGDIKSVTENLKMLGDVSMGDKDHLNGLVLAYSQVAASGKMNAGDLNQFINAGWNPLEQMSKQTGKTIGQLKEEIGEGKISFEKLHEALVGATSEGGKFNNMLGTIAQTPFGKLQQLKGAWEELKIKAGNAFTPLISFALDLANKVMPYLEKMVEPLAKGVEKVAGVMQTAIGYIKSAAPAIMSFFAPVAEYISGAIAKVREFFTSASQKATVFMRYIEAAKGTYEHFGNLLRNVIDTIGDFISQIYDFVSSSELLADIFSVIQSVLSFAYDAISWIIGKIKSFFDNVVMPILNKIEKVYRIVKGLVTDNSSVTITAKSAAQSAALVSDAAQSAVPAATADGDALSQKSAAKSTSNILQQIADNTKNNGTSADKAAKSVASSGPKVVNISLGKFFDNIVFNTTNLQESSSKLESVVTECLSRILLDGAKSI